MVAVLVLVLVLVVSSLDASPGDQPPPSAGGKDASRPWWANDDSPSPTPSPARSPHTYLIVGPEGQLSTPTPPPVANPVVNPPPRKRRAAQVPTFRAVAGPGCAQGDTQGYRAVGSYTDGDRGWYDRPSGGWERDGCTGRFDALPMSGSPTDDDTSAYSLWWFTPRNLRAGTCALSVFIPTGREAHDVAGKPAFYNVIAGPDDLTRLAGFWIDQVVNRGRWLPAGRYPLRDGQLGVQLMTRGQDPNGEHLAAAQIRAECR